MPRPEEEVADQDDSGPVKLYACEMVNRVTSEALQIHGVRIHEGVPAGTLPQGRQAYAIGAGTSEIQKLIIGGYLMA